MTYLLLLPVRATPGSAEHPLWQTGLLGLVAVASVVVPPLLFLLSFGASFGDETGADTRLADELWGACLTSLFVLPGTGLTVAAVTRRPVWAALFGCLLAVAAYLVGRYVLLAR